MTGVIKICGLSTFEALDAAIGAGADLVGFVRYPRSPRHVSLELGRALSVAARGRAARVLLVVDPSDGDLDDATAALDPDFVQLHGSESPDKVAAIRKRSGRPVIKALGIGSAADLRVATAYRGVADRILLDARPPVGAARPGGNGQAFDWSLLGGFDVALDRPGAVMLSGGLGAESVAVAVAATGIRGVDVSSGVERAPGEKDPDRIVAFVAAARRAFAQAAGERTT